VEAWQPRDLWDRAFAAAKGNRQERLIRPMSCVAREIGQYWLAHQAAPPHKLEQFMIAACGAAVLQIGFPDPEWQLSWFFCKCLTQRPL
jgi:hypothetical protein